MIGGRHDTVIPVHILEAVVSCLYHKIIKLFGCLDGSGINAQRFGNITADKYAVSPLCDIRVISCHLRGEDISRAVVFRGINVCLQIFLPDYANVIGIGNIRIIRNQILDINQTAFHTCFFDDRRLTGRSAPVRCIHHVRHIS